MVAARCPGALHLVEARDGLLARIRVPGGFLNRAQWDAIAEISERCGDGRIDVTARANVQLRGLREDAREEIARRLFAADLLPSVEHDRVRNVLASPFAGMDASEIIDTRPLVRALDLFIMRDRTLAELSPKFSFAIDGGGMASAYLTGNVVARAYADERGVRFEVRSRASVFADDVAAGTVVETLVKAARVSRADQDEGPRVATRFIFGVLPGCDGEHVNIAPVLPLGRIDVGQACGIARLARAYAGDIRLAPWRAIVIAGVKRASVEGITQRLGELGLTLDGSDGFAGIAACAGIHGCTQATADVRADALALAKRLAGTRVDPMRTINFAGCAKRCAMRGGATTEFVATPDGYAVDPLEFAG